ncbi:GGDEF domain-containing protein [Hansschlegelia sp. KR7-227]|uniref:GGDEF domain-containing protein n=1 Tax=Hansschlegelia sp. KR7-227 TaxID=3400914 RepID=UPI003C0BB81B
MSAYEATADEDGRLAALARYDILDTPPEEAFDRITRLAQKIFHAPIATVSLLDGHRQWFKSAQGLTASETPRDMAFCNVPIQRRAPLVVHDAAAHPEFRDNPMVVGEPHIRFYAGAPLKSPDGHVVGTLCVMDREPRTFDDADLAVLIDLAHIVTDELELRLLANVDSLTGALSRIAFREEAGRAVALAKRHKHPFSLVVLDLDHFKQINDEHGHAFGDTVLARMAAACLRELRTSDAIGRIGGEEFAILLPHAGAKAAQDVAERLRRAVAAEHVVAQGVVIPVTASLGLASVTRVTTDFDGLLAHAEAALSEAKAAGRNRVVASRVSNDAVEAVGQRVFKGGRILFNHGMSSRDCTIRTQSDVGAGIDVADASGLPERFDLQIGADRTLISCRILKLTSRRVEVAFE